MNLNISKLISRCHVFLQLNTANIYLYLNKYFIIIVSSYYGLFYEQYEKQYC